MRSREAIVREAVALATVHGLEGMSIGELASALHIFRAEVIDPALAASAGLAQLLAVCDAFFDYLLRGTFPGGCFFAGAVLEMGTRPGPVKERVAAFQDQFTALIRQFVVQAQQQGELGADEDADALTFELSGMILAANATFVLHDDASVPAMAKAVVRRRLGVGTTTSHRHAVQ
jgi:AcrR family transcriptional regulator